MQAGFFHSAVPLGDGRVFTFGLNGSGQLGDGTYTYNATGGTVLGLTDAEMIAAGVRYNLAVRVDGSLWAWGSNGSGELGDGGGANRNAPVRVIGY